jgi:hypothetical protein
MFNSPLILTMYAEARLREDHALKRVQPAACRLSLPLPRLWSRFKIVNNHNQSAARRVRPA